jgi:hypothetical protein
MGHQTSDHGFDLAPTVVVVIRRLLRMGRIIAEGLPRFAAAMHPTMKPLCIYIYIYIYI